ncbi:hypothetical protein [Erwinia tasmaniensis]|uniref:Uncharacterized protein n=1 Tax=Erwinia tasmaniensis (strain DSM 17950 / CFBP 7177 / CIP 109463 / NCPPB 4357 / Et1/99) TaxID=465817 RepID=B2VG35_ERWT9|nr:hypothetical protein [Erwinia tasmaniensis]CAO97724.1 Hypothetical protein ETA_26780 [Erwinia tasmaniensis Et1/99]
MTYNITSSNRSQIIDLNKLCARNDENRQSGVAGSITTLSNDPSVVRVVKDFSCYPSQAETVSALLGALSMKDLPPEVANTTMSQNGESVKSLLGLIAGNIEDKQDKKTLEKIYSQLIDAKADTKKEAKVGPDLNRLLVKYGKDSLNNHVATCLDACRQAWAYNHTVTGSPDNIDDNCIFSTSLLGCHNVLNDVIEKISNPGSDFNLIAQQAVFFKDTCASIPLTLINHDNQDIGPKEHSTEPNRSKMLDPQVSARANNGPWPINIHVEGATANATINGNSSPTPTKSDQALINFATKLLYARPEDLTETKVKLINKALDLAREHDRNNGGADGILQNLQHVTPVQDIISYESVSANQRLAQVIHQPDTSAAEKPADSADSESLIMNAKRLQPHPLANDIAEIDAVAVSSTATPSEMIPKILRQDLNRSAERTSTAPELKERTNKPEQSEIPEKWVETIQTELVAYSVGNKVGLTSLVADAVDESSIRETPLLHAAKQVSGLSDNIPVEVTQPSDSRTHPRDGAGIHSGGNPNNPFDSGSKDSRSDERDIFADNQPAYGGSGSYVQQTVNRFEKEFIRLRPKATPFVSGNSIFGNNSESGAKSSAERKSHLQDTTKYNRFAITGNSPRIHTTNRSFDPFNQRSIPLMNHVRQFSPGITGINKGESKKAENNLGEVFLDNQELQHE